MSLSILPLQATTQPQHLTGIDWNNPITRGLKLVMNPAAGATNIVTGEGMSFTGTVDINAKGAGKSFGNTGSVFNHLQAACNYGTDITVFALMQNSASGSIQPFFDDDDTGASNRCFQFRQNSSNQIEFIRFNSSNSPFTAVNTNTLSATQLDTGYSAGGMCIGASVYAWQGKLKSGAVTLTGSAHTSTAPIRLFAGKWIGSPGLNGMMQLALLWDRCLSDEEYKSIVDNPWQIFRNQGIPIWITVVGSTTNASGNIATSSLSAPTGSATATSDGSANGSINTSQLVSPTGTASTTTDGTASGSLLATSLSNPSGAATGGTAGSGSGGISQINIEAPVGASSGYANISSSVATATLSSPSGAASGGIGATASGSFVSVTFSSPTAAASGIATASGSIFTTTLSAPQGSASSGVSATGSGSIAQTTLSILSGVGSGDVNVSGGIAGSALVGVSGAANAEANAFGGVPNVSLSIVSGGASSLDSIIASGSIANTQLVAVTGYVYASSTVTSNIDSIVFTAPNGNAIGTGGASSVRVISIKLQKQNRTINVSKQDRTIIL